MVALVPLPVHAQCKQWDVSGKWTLEQSDGYTVTVDLKQNGNSITGRAWHDTGSIKSGGTRLPDGNIRVKTRSVLGNISGNDLYMQLDWGKSTTGVYRGEIGSHGRIEGRMYQKENVATRARWFSTTAMRCADASGGAESAAPVPERTTVQPGPALKAPYIQANPPGLVPIARGQLQGSATLLWDGGKEHPYAEVWVREGEGISKFIVQKGAGTRQVTVQRGKTYRYMLMDGTSQLGAVTVQGSP